MDKVNTNHVNEQRTNIDDKQERRTYFVDRAGDRATGLFPGWGPKL